MILMLSLYLERVSLDIGSVDGGKRKRDVFWCENFFFKLTEKERDRRVVRDLCRIKKRHLTLRHFATSFSMNVY